MVLGAVALVIAIGATVTAGRHRYFLTGRTQAGVALLLAVATVVVGSLALAGALPWLETGTNHVEQLRDVLPSWLT